MRILIALPFLLMACSTQEQLTATCQGYGFTPGTTAFAECLQRETIAADERRQRAAQSLQQLGADLQTRSSTRRPVVCTQTFNTVTCQ